MKSGWPLLLLIVLVSSCAVTKKYNPNQKIAPQQLQKDYAVFRSVLEESHPGLYWYTPKDSMDYYFAKGQAMLKDSLTETRFRNVLSYVIAQIHCGHTSVRPSKPASRYMQSVRLKSFPLNFKIWPDTAVVTGNMHRKDSALVKGAIVTAIDNRPMQVIIDTFFKHISADGYNTTHKYQTLSNRNGFANMYNAIYGLHTKYLVHYIDTLGRKNVALTNLYNPVIDSGRRISPLEKRLNRRERKKQLWQAVRSLKIDTALNTGFMDLNTFVKGYNLRPFFKASFKKLRKEKVENLIIDLRGNGGGSVTNSTLLSRYIAHKRFKIADSLYAVTRNTKYGHYQQNHIWNWLFLVFMTHKQKDGNYHFKYFEKHYFKPKKRNHFNGTTYVLSGGNTFSASTLFLQAVKGQQNVKVVGEETGGGAYGNNAWLIPDVTLPNTGVRFRLPLLRLVIDKNNTKGYGIKPEVEVTPTIKAIRNNIDYKMEKAIELIKRKSGFMMTDDN